MLSDIQSVIFDLDGTLIDSMGIWYKIDREYLENRNIPIPENLISEINSLSFDSVAVYFKDKFNLEDSLEDIKETWLSMAHIEYSKMPLKPGVKEFLLSLKNSGIKIGLATSNCMHLLETVLKNNNVFHLFDSITITDEVSKSKAFPDVYLLAAKKLGVAPENCLVFEDILPAIKGAKAANMKVACVYDTHSIDCLDKMKKEANYYVESYETLA